MKLFILACFAITMAAGDMSFPGNYDNYLNLARMYRMKELANLYDNYRDIDDLEGRSVNADSWSPVGGYDEAYASPILRDQEHIEQSSLHGYQSMTGGSPNSKPKSDKSLPAYCNPPNPCPFGKTADDNCVEGFTNSADNNKQLLDKQECPCDTEHMFSCPAGGNTVSSKSQGDAVAINKVMDELQKLDSDLGTNFVADGSKRISVVAKKSPHLIKKRATRMRHARNPYLAGRRLRTVAKKSPPLKN